MPDGETDTVEVPIAKQEADFQEIGRTGVDRSAGIIQEEHLTALKGSKGIKRYKEMRDNDPIVGASILAIKNLIRQADWFITPASESPEDQERAAFIESAFEDMDQPFERFISDTLSMLVFGWSWFEIVYKRRDGNPLEEKGSQFNDGRIGWHKFALRSQDSLERWEFDDKDSVIAMIQRPEPSFREHRIPASKSLHFVTDGNKANPLGRSILRNAFRSWYFRKHIEEYEGMGIERDLVGLPKITVPPRILKDSATEQEKATLDAVKKMGQNIRNDEEAAVIIPAVYDESGNKLFDFELMSTRGRKKFDTGEVIDRKNREIAISMLSDFLLLGHESVGSFALASSKTHIFGTAIGAYMDIIAEEINRNAIPKLLALNGMLEGENIPKLNHTDIETVDLEQLAEFVSALSGAGIDISGEEIKNELFRQAGLPTTDEQSSMNKINGQGRGV